MPQLEYPECGKIINTHGFRGGVKIEPWCDTPAVLSRLPAVYIKKGGALARKAIRRASVFRRFVFAELDGVSTMEEAQALLGTILYAKRDDLKLPTGTVLVAEMTGMPVFDAQSGEKLGIVREVIHPGVQDIYVIDTPRGEGMVPAVPAFVKRLDPDGLYLDTIEGMLP